MAMYGPKLTYTASEPIGKASNNVAELEAIRVALQELSRKQPDSSTSVHLFTDSQYAQEVLLSTKISKKHFLLVETIRGLGWQLANERGIHVHVHWVPSHIEKTLGKGRSIKGNKKADEQAETARNASKDIHTPLQTTKQRERLLKAIGDTLQAINGLLPAEKPQPQNGPSPDDFCKDASPNAPNEFGDSGASFPGD